jgi:hypothetical protein
MHQATIYLNPTLPDSIGFAQAAGVPGDVRFYFKLPGGLPLEIAGLNPRFSVEVYTRNTQMQPLDMIACGRIAPAPTLWPHAADLSADFSLRKICGATRSRAHGSPRGPPMRHTALALFVVEPTRRSFAVGIAASRIARKFEFLDGSLPGGVPNLPAAQDAACFELPLYLLRFGRFHAQRRFDKRPRRYPWSAGILALALRGGVAQARPAFRRDFQGIDDLPVPLSVLRGFRLLEGCCRQPLQSGDARHRNSPRQTLVRDSSPLVKQRNSA